MSSCRKVGAIDGGAEKMPRNWLPPKNEGRGDADDADQDGARHARALSSATMARKPSTARITGGRVQVAQRHQGGLVADDDTGALERDQCQEQTDAHGDGAAQRLRYAVDDVPAYAEQRRPGTNSRR